MNAGLAMANPPRGNDAIRRGLAPAHSDAAGLSKPTRRKVPVGEAALATPELVMVHTAARAQSSNEEIANSLSHGLGAVLAAAFSPQLIGNALHAGGMHGI